MVPVFQNFGGNLGVFRAFKSYMDPRKPLSNITGATAQVAFFTAFGFVLLNVHKKQLVQFNHDVK